MSDTLTEAPPLPPALQLEITSACNLRCTMCLVSYQAPVNKLAGAMTPQLFARVLDEVPTLRSLTLQGLGEPLLSPYLMDQLTLARRHGIRTGFNSNATLLTRRRADELVAAGLDWLHISLDGARAGTYEAIRAGGNFDDVVTNLAGLLAARRAAGSDRPWVRVVFVAMRSNVAELPELVRMLALAGVDELRVQNLSHSFDDTDPAGRYAGIRDFTAAQALWTGRDLAVAEVAFAAAREAARDHAVTLRLPRLRAPDRPAGSPALDPPAGSPALDPPAGSPALDPPAPGGAGRPGCTWPWDAAYVTSRGVVQPCCMVMGDDRVQLGDLTRQSFPDIWYGELYARFRARLAGGDPPEVCRGCSLYHRTF